MLFGHCVDVCSIIGFSLFSICAGSFQFIKMRCFQVVDGAGVASIFFIMLLFVSLLHSFDRIVELLNYGLMFFLLLYLGFLAICHHFFELFLVTRFHIVHCLIMSIYNIIIIILHFSNNVCVILMGFVFELFMVRFPLLECVLMLLMGLFSRTCMVVVHFLFVLDVKSFFFLLGLSQSCRFILMFILYRL